MKNPNSSSIKSRFTGRFLKAINKINRRKSPSASPREVFLRYRRVKIAADSSMANAVRSNRAWSRAVLMKIKNQKGHKATHKIKNCKRLVVTRTAAAAASGGDEIGFEQEDELRKLVPGVEAMDFCSMLDETAHYVKCLATQVQVMRKIVDFYSS